MEQLLPQPLRHSIFALLESAINELLSYRCRCCETGLAGWSMDTSQVSINHQKARDGRRSPWLDSPGRIQHCSCSPPVENFAGEIRKHMTLQQNSCINRKMHPSTEDTIKWSKVSPQRRSAMSG